VAEGISRLVRTFGSRLAIGAGTVLEPDEVKRVADLGAAFIVSPNRNIRVIEMTKKLGLASFPGAFTPSEAIEACDAGADAVKLFPAMCLGPGFVKALRGPLPTMRTVPTGGVDAKTAGAYFDAGAWAVGVGSELVSSDALAPGGLDRLRGRARAFVAAISRK
jgi:2-dehydro-3-deoxyphosphogluconate aldolase/(4S)-4-hydroxy-2-oxoglutarate aldolase